ncbi:MAG: helix-turn-helix domain-containing protein [Cytophagales bacterium]|nr:helix-turn-helix domain-containing protein [Cytophagales bacterium]
MENEHDFIIIHNFVKRDRALSDKAKLLYGDLYSLSQKKGYCFASNQYLANQYGSSTRTITRALQELKKNNYIHIVSLSQTGKTDLRVRRIYVLDKNGVSGDKMNAKESAGRKKCPGGLVENVFGPATNLSRVEDIFVYDNKYCNKKEEEIKYLLNQFFLFCQKKGMHKNIEEVTLPLFETLYDKLFDAYKEKLKSNWGNILESAYQLDMLTPGTLLKKLNSIHRKKVKKKTPGKTIAPAYDLDRYMQLI